MDTVICTEMASEKKPSVLDSGVVLVIYLSTAGLPPGWVRGEINGTQVRC